MTGDEQPSLFPDDDGRVRLQLPELWVEQGGPDFDVAISTRMRLARNVDGFHFKSRFAEGEGERLELYLREVLCEVEPGLRYLTVDALGEVERNVLFERQLVSRELVKDDTRRGVAYSPDGTVSVMVNEEDHLRLAVFAPGFDLDAVMERAGDLDDRLAAQLDYSFTPRYGFLTSCPTNCGTGMRVSVMLHLPALGFQPSHKQRSNRRTHQIVKVNNAARDLDLTVRGMHGESSRADGDFYQISNQVTLGRPVADVVQTVRDLTETVIAWERRDRESHLSDNRSAIEDHVWRSWAILTHARKLSSSEALGHISAVRLGVSLGLIDTVDMGTLQRLLVVMRPGHLQMGANEPLLPDARDEVRAELVRATLSRRPSAR